jgi:phosphoglycerate kinase
VALQFIDEVDVKGKNILARFDFNVPLNKKGQITDTTRIDMAIPTLKYCLENECKHLVLMAHLGRPKGKRDDKYSLSPVAEYLATMLDKDVILTESAVDGGIKQVLASTNSKILLLENIRFSKEETENSTEFAKTLSQYGDIYLNDAFGTCHRKHTSTHEIVRYFPKKAYGGLILKNEIKALNKITNKPESPFIGIIGGAKISDKIKIIESLLPQVDSLLIGGAMAYPFLNAQGHNIGRSLCSEDDVVLAKQLLNSKLGHKISLPVDHVVSPNMGPEGKENIDDLDIPKKMMGLDIGERTVSRFKEKLHNAKSVLWNGPMGFFEEEAFAQGTLSIARILAEMDAYTLVGGGDSVAAVKKTGLEKNFSHISTGGGASLEYIEQGSLPGINALKFGVS